MNAPIVPAAPPAVCDNPAALAAPGAAQAVPSYPSPTQAQNAAPAPAQGPAWGNVPLPLQQRRQWLLAGPNDKGELKVPKTVSEATGWQPAPGSSTDRSTWLDFETAVAAARYYGMGIGYVLAAEDPFVCVDYDVKNTVNEPDPAKHTPAEHVAQMRQQVEDLDSYTELSQSGQGVHVWVYGKFDGDGIKRKGVEVYQDARFIACTGNSIHDPAKSIEDRSDDIAQLVAVMRGSDAVQVAHMVLTEVPTEESDDALLVRARGYANADKFNALWTGQWATWEEPGMDGRPWKPYPSQSEADMALMGMLALYSKSNEQCRRLFLASALGEREKADGRHGPKYLNRMLRKIRGRQAAEDARRVEQMDRNRSIGEDTPEPLTGVVLTLEEMCNQLVYVRIGSGVAWRDMPRRNHSGRDAPGLFAGCIKYELNAKGKMVPIDLFPEWRSAGLKRTDVETLTFDPRYGRFCRDPDGLEALNLWTPLPRMAPPDNWEALSSLFTNHVGYLIPAERERELFLDWLAHIEQSPGELPHTGYLMIARAQGVGRNWLAGVFARLWRGHVAVNFDLSATLTKGFNHHLSRKLLAVVDEINEGGTGDQWAHAEKLKKMVTEEERRINKKYGLEWTERNCCRWLMFSNHETAIPLTDNDRRWHVIRNPDQPRPPEYYVQLYAMLDNPAFIAAVRELLRRRDLRNFNPGMPAAMNEAKKAVIGATKSEAAEQAEGLVRDWPSDAITSEMLGSRLFGSGLGKHQNQVKHRAHEAGMKRWRGPEGKDRARLRFGAGEAMSVWVLRNHDRWVTADADAIRSEIARALQS